MSERSFSSEHSLVNRWDNGNADRNDVGIIAKNNDSNVDVSSIDNNWIASISLVAAGGVTSTSAGKFILTMDQNANFGKNKTISSSHKVEFHENKADDWSVKLGGKQHVTT